MKTEYTHLVMVLDRSGSMQERKSDTIGGFNDLVKSQKAAPGRATFGLFTFASSDDVKYDGHSDLSGLKELTPATYVCRGNTAMYDGIMLALNETGSWLSEMDEADRPAHVAVVILTDGEENDSRKFTREQVATAVQHQQEAYGWHFTFLGANQDAVVGGAAIGVAASASQTFTPKNVRVAYVNVSAALVRMRGGVASSIMYTDAERAAAIKK